MQCKVILAGAAEQSLSGVSGVIRGQGGPTPGHSPARPGGGVAVGVAPPAPPYSYLVWPVKRSFVKLRPKMN